MVKRKSAIDRSCIVEIFGPDYNRAINQNLEIKPNDEAVFEDPNGYMYLVKDEGCAPSNEIVDIDVDYVDLTLPDIKYRTSEDKTIAGLKFRLQRQ